MERAKKLLETGQVAPPCKHVNRRKAERDITTIDIEQVILSGRVVDTSWVNYEWRYKISGILTDGERMACVVTLGQYLCVITVMWDKPIVR